MNIKLITENVYKQMAADNKARIAREKAEAKAKVEANKPKSLTATDRKRNFHQELAHHIMIEVANSYPDTDGTDALYPLVNKLKAKHGIYDRFEHEHLDAATKAHLGAKSFSHYYDNVDADYKGSNPGTNY